MLAGIQYAFIDNFGNYDFDKNDISTHFIIVAILVKGSTKNFWSEKSR